MSRPLVLCYHAVSSTWPSPLATPERALARQVGLLRRRGYVGLTATEAERRRNERTLPPRSVVFTFDDAYASTARALPILAAAGYPGTVFVVTGFLEDGAPLSWPGLDRLAAGHRDELRPLGIEALERLARAGWEIGSHTVSHGFLPALDDRTLAHELEASRERLAGAFGGCTSVAYPYGAADPRVASAARAAGYATAFTMLSDPPVDEPFRRTRVGMGGDVHGLRLRVKLSPARIRLRRTPVGSRVASSLGRGKPRGYAASVR